MDSALRWLPPVARGRRLFPSRRLFVVASRRGQGRRSQRFRACRCAAYAGHQRAVHRAPRRHPVFHCLPLRLGLESPGRAQWHRTALYHPGRSSYPIWWAGTGATVRREKHAGRRSARGDQACPVPPAVSTSVPAKPAPAPASTTTPPSSGATPVVAGPAVGGWAWPASGSLIGRFASNGSLNKGIDIAGQLGQPVLAASGGTVVYAGSGLRGYGELVIIKHNETYVSAYGHNRRLLVREGQQVKVGQSIAEMGSTGTDRVKLHFEIRRQGKPVDPLQYLPRR